MEGDSDEEDVVGHDHSNAIDEELNLAQEIAR